MNYANDSAVLSSGLACWPRPSVSASLRGGSLESGLMLLRPSRSAFTSPAIRPMQILLSSAHKEKRRPSRSAVSIALRGLAPMAERLFSNPPSHFPATKYR